MCNSGKKKLRYVSMILGLAIAGTGIGAFFMENIADIACFQWPVLAANMIFLGLLSVIVMLHFPKRLNTVTKRWFPFLRTWRGRGFYLIFLGSISASLNYVALIVGGICVLVGILHIFLLCFFRDTLDKTGVRNEMEAARGDKKKEEGITV
jgi:hypothetical protein